MGRLLYRYCTENVKFRHVHCCNCMFAEDYCSYSLNTKLCLGKRWKFYQYITFASASGGLSHRPPTRALPLDSWGHASPDLLTRPPFEICGSTCEPSIVSSWVRLWLVQIGNGECITTHLAAPTKLLRRKKRLSDTAPSKRLLGANPCYW